MRPGPESVHLEIFLQVSYQYYSVHIYLGILSGFPSLQPAMIENLVKEEITAQVWC